MPASLMAIYIFKPVCLSVHLDASGGTVIIFFAAYCFYINAQNIEQNENPKYLQQKLRFSHLTIDEGLSQGFVSSIPYLQYSMQ